MARLTKRQKQFRERIEASRLYPVEEAFGLLKELASASFSESVDVAVNLGVDPRKSDQMIRRATILPNGTGKTVRVAVFAEGEAAESAREAGADIVGFEDQAEQIQGGMLDFDKVIATPDAMRVVGKLGRILGPRGLMPNPKTNTVTKDVATAVQNAKAGEVSYRTDKAGIIHCAIGRADFEIGALTENLEALLTDLHKAKPAAAKGVYMKRVTVSSTMGPGIPLDQTSLSF